MRDHRDVMAGLATALSWQRGVEVGVGTGKLFARFLSLGIEMVGVDLGLRPDRVRMIEDIIDGRTGIERVNARMCWMPSISAANHIPDAWADFVFIDAGHSYEAVRADISAWEPKVRPGGWFGGHDFHDAHPGVIKAVRERYGDKFDLLEGWIWARK